MKIFSTITLTLLLVVVFSLPASASAATNPGIKPGSFFYFFDTTFEKIGLFFTFSPEKKAEKALEYADERLAEAGAVAEDAEAVKTAITNYESNIAFAEEKSKDVGDKEKAEALLTSIADNTSKHQEVLLDVFVKVPDEAKEALTRAIEASRKGHEEAMQKIAELKGEVEKLKQEVSELKSKDEERGKIIEELSNQKQKTTPSSAKPATTKTSTTPTPKPATTPSQTQTQTSEPQNTQTTVQLPSNTTNTTPAPTTQTQTSTTIQILSVSVVPSLSSAKIEWQTNVPTNSKIFLSGGSLSSKVYSSESGLSTRHIVNAAGLTSGTTYSYEIEAITGDQVAKKDGSFSTKPDEYTISIQPDKTSVPASGFNGIVFKVSTLKNGQNQTNQTISVVTTDAAQNKTFSDSFTYYPKTVGTHTLVFSWNGVKKSTDVEATEYIVIPHFVADISFDKETIANDEIDSIKVTIITKDSSGKVLPNKSVQIKTYKTETLTSDQNGIINTTITTTEAGGQHSLVVSADNRSYSKNYQVINVRKKISFGVLSAADFGNISAPAINEGLIMLVFDKSFSEIQNLKLKKVSFKLEGLTPDWITNIKFTKSEADDRHDVLPPVIIPSTYSFTPDGMVSLIPSAPIEMFYNDRLTIVADIKNNSDQKSGTGVKILEYAVIVYQDSFEFSGVVSGRTGIITPELTNYNYGPNALLTLPSRKTNWVVTNYCMSGNTIVTCFDQ